MKTATDVIAGVIADVIADIIADVIDEGRVYFQCCLVAN